MFGQVVIGPPGSGKSTYCHGMYQFMSAIGRKLCVINLDPANDRLPYSNCALDIRDILTLDEVMEQLSLGPNGGLMYALECLSSIEIDEFVAKIKKLADENYYLLIDCPGQVELFTHHNSLYQILKMVTKKAGVRLCSVSLVDSIYLTSPSQLEYYTEVQNLRYLLPYLERESNSVLGKKFLRLTEAIGDLIEDFNLVSFEVLSIENKKSMIHLVNIIDKANGYTFGASEVGGDMIWTEATRQSSTINDMGVDIHERWIEKKLSYDRLEEMEALRLHKDISEVSNEPHDEDDAYEKELQDWEETNK